MLNPTRARKLLVLGAALALAAMVACEADETDSAPEEPANSPTVVSGAPAGTDKASTVVDAVDADARIEAAAREFLAAEVGEGAFDLRSAEGMQWSDASLGCPEDGSFYAQVITPGYKLVFDLDGTLYPVHSNGDGSHMVICGDGR